MKSWKRKWKRQLDAALPALREDIAAYPISVDTAVHNGRTLVRSHRPAVIIASFAAALIFLVGLFCVWLLPSRERDNSFVFLVEINPAITLSADGDGIVTGVVSSNPDADVILSGEEGNMKGKSLGEAVVWYTDEAAKLGYLNLSETDAVRITSCGEDGGYLSSAKSSLEDYFMAEGIYSVVVTSTEEWSQFLQMCGLGDYGDVQQLAHYVESAQPMTYVRRSQTLETDKLVEVYEEYVSSDAFIDAVGTFLNDNLSAVRDSAEDIGELYSLYFEIYYHKNNPALLLKDYWNVKKYYGNELTGEFGDLVARMDAALESYRNKYGVDITNEQQLSQAAADYMEMSAEKLAALIENLTAQSLIQNITAISDILALSGIDGEPLEFILELPADAREFTEKISAVLSVEYSSREQSYAEEYAVERTAIDAEDYALFVQDIISRYGSLEDFWASQK